MHFLLLGLGSGASYAAVALGLLLTYRSSGVVNFAHGAVAMYGTYVFVGLRGPGELLLPLPGPPGRLSVGVLPTAAAVVVSVVAAAALEVAMYVVVFRPLRHSPALSRIVASVGLMIALQAVVALQRGSSAVSVPSLLPTGSVSVLGSRVPADRLVLAGLVCVAGAALAVVDRLSRFGLACRAAAEDETALALVGWSPDLVAGASWALAGALAAVGGILVGPITTLDPVSFTLLVVPALAAALVSRFASFGVTVAVALALGALQSELVDLQSRASWLPASGIGKALPLVVVVATAVARGSLLPGRGEVGERRLPQVGRPSRPWLSALGGFGAGAIVLVVLHGQWRLAFITSVVGAVICLSLVVLTGYLGQTSLAQMALAGVGGFALSRMQRQLHLPFPVDLTVAAVLAAAAGLVIGVPALRVRGAGLAVATLAGALSIQALLFADPRITGGFAGTPVTAPSIGGLSLRPSGRGEEYPRLAFGLLVLALLCVVAGAVGALRRGPVGRRLLAVRANERAAAASGVAVTRTKLLGFALSSAIAGLAGGMLGWQQGRLSFDSFDVFVSLSYVAVAYVGGIGSVAGAVIGGALVSSGLAFTALDQAVGAGRYQLLISGLAVVVMSVLAPDGVAGAVLLRWRRRATRTAVADEAGR